ncbi:MFS transporter [bacterium]|nr:MFS transporter [bacterium]
MTRSEQPAEKSKFSIWLLTFPLFFINFLVFSEHLIVVPLTASISLATGLPPVNSGLLVAIYPLAAALSALILAPFSDRLGRKRMLVLLCLGFSFSSYNFATADSVTSVLLFRVLSGIFGGPIPANVLAYVGDRFQGAERTKVITTIMLAFSVASILAVPFGAWIADLTTWRVPFYIISGIILVCLVLMLRMRVVKTGAEGGNIFRQYVEFANLLKLGRVRKVFTLQFFMIIGLFGFVPNVAVWLSTNYGFDSTQIGLCYMQGGIGGIIGNTLSGYFINKGHKGRLITIGSLVMCVFLAFSAQDFLPPVYSGIFFFGLMLGGSFRIPALQVIITEIIPINLRGRMMALSMIVSNITMGLGGIWSIPFLKLENGVLTGMKAITLIGSISLLAVPFLVSILEKEIRQVKQFY